MPPHSQATSNPKKMKAKCKVTESGIPALTGQGKKAWTADEVGLVSLQLPPPDVNAPIHCSGHSGAGTGGRNAQLEKVGAALMAPTRTSQPKGSMTLAPNISANPLAPEPVSNGTGSTVMSSHQKGKKAKTSSAPDPQVDPVVNTPPQGSPPIMPPGTEPDLAVQSYAGGHQSSSSGPANEDLLRSAPPSCPSSTTCIIPTFSEENLDPSLRTVGSKPMNNLSLRTDTDNRACSTVQSLAGGRSGKSSAGGEADDDSGDSDNAGEGEFGWVEVGKRHHVHPGFSQERVPSPVHVTSTLAPNFDFQHSHDEDDMNARQILDFDNPLSDEITSEGSQRVPEVSELGGSSQPVAHDVLNQHHKKNGLPHLPDPASLELLRHVAGTMDLKNNGPINTQQPAKAKCSPDRPRPTQLVFYPACWKSFLKDAKEGCCAQHALESPFPAQVKDSPCSVTEALLAALYQWDNAGKQFEPDYWPIHKPDMAKLLYEDLSTWHSKLKKNVVMIASTMPGLVPPSNIPPQECASWVEGAATELKVDSKFLRDGMDEQGKTRNFANPALHNVIIMFFYTGPYRIARRHPDVFSKQLPLSCLALVSAAFICILDGLAKNSSGKSSPKFTAKEYRPTYASALKSLGEIMDHPYHGPRLVKQLQSWAEAGWAASCKVDGDEMAYDVDIKIMLD
ncbi:hypothetical protein EDB19DRAFT_1829570 [Suillus lakei]|nr:hypothetical protein EDB19DRAFT_1829570 [Suillus lakei]